MHNHPHVNPAVVGQQSPKTLWRYPHYVTCACLLLGGIIIGRVCFPLTIEKPYFVEKVIEKPVERVIEKRIEVPVERRVEVPVEKIVYVSERARGGSGAQPFLISSEKLAMWRQIKVGMTRKEVTDILGAPTEVFSGMIMTAAGVRMTRWFWGTGQEVGYIDFEHGGGGSVMKISIPER